MRDRERDLERRLELTVSPRVDFIDDVRRLSVAFCVAEGLTRQLADACGLAVHELVHNAALYSPDGRATLTIRVQAESPRLLIAVRNRATAAAIDALAKHVALVQAADPLAAHVALLSHAGEDRPMEGAGLGLVRIRHEASMALEVSTEGEVVIVRASATAGVQL